MKIFIDSADVWAIKDAYETGLIDGVTTNPTLIMKSGRHPEKVYQKLKDMGIGDISMEVVGNAETMINEGRRLKAKFGDCTTIKVPCTPDGLLACHTLSKELISFPSVTPTDAGAIKFLSKKLKLLGFKCKILKNCNAYRLDDFLTKYRIRKNSLQSNNFRNFFWIWKINKNLNKLNFFQNLMSLFFISFNSLKKYGFKNL